MVYVKIVGTSLGDRKLRERGKVIGVGFHIGECSRIDWYSSQKSTGIGPP